MVGDEFLQDHQEEDLGQSDREPETRQPGKAVDDHHERRRKAEGGGGESTIMTKQQQSSRDDGARSGVVVHLSIIIVTPASCSLYNSIPPAIQFVWAVKWAGPSPRMSPWSHLALRSFL